jgi:RimJ/RimL family protein N-acetyltransferase
MGHIDIQRITTLPLQLHELEQEAIGQGFRFLTRLRQDWESGANRFDAPGECLMAAFLDSEWVGIGGLSRDPYQQGDTARLRRLFVADAARGRGVGKALVSRLVEHAAQHFRVVHLSTDTPQGAAFYLRCGFQPASGAHVTHTKTLDAALSLRPVVASDRPQIQHWAASINSSEFMARHEPLAGQSLLWDIVHRAGLDVGVAWLERTDIPDQARLGIMLAAPALLGRGIGQAAVMQVLAKARHCLSMRSVVLNVRETNVRAIACYERCGFTREARSLRHADGREYAVWQMLKILV